VGDVVDLHSADARTFEGSATGKSAIRQVENLRYAACQGRWEIGAAGCRFVVRGQGASIQFVAGIGSEPETFRKQNSMDLRLLGRKQTSMRDSAIIMRQDDCDHWIAPLEERMVNCVWRIVRHPQDTDDVIQEVLLRVTQRFDTMRRHPNPTAWLLRTCVNAAVDHLRRRKTQPFSVEEAPEIESADAEAPDRSLVRKEQWIALLAFLRELPEREAEAITLHALEGLEYPRSPKQWDARKPPFVCWWLVMTDASSHLIARSNQSMPVIWGRSL